MIEIYFLPSWFEPFIMLWLEENDDQSMEYMYNAIDKDKKEGVKLPIIKCYNSVTDSTVFEI